MIWRGAFLLLAVGCSSVSISERTQRPAGAPGTSSLDETHVYNRREWHHWIDADHDCQDTRQEVLIAESEVPVEFTDERHCRVKRGRWTCPYTGQVVTDPRELDIDHLVPLENACTSGGWRWSRAKKEAFANDLEHREALVAVVASANRQKGSKGPDAWLPQGAQQRCDYVAAWAGIKQRWALSETPAEVAALNREERLCRGAH